MGVVFFFEFYGIVLSVVGDVLVNSKAVVMTLLISRIYRLNLRIYS